MQRYKSKYTGPQMDVAFERALPGGAIDLSLSDKQYFEFLDNTDFTNPVAQAGIGGLHGSVAYAVDRWKLISGTVSGTSNGLTLNGTIRQIREFPIGLPVIPSVEMHSGTATITYDDTAKYCDITSSGGVIKRAHLGLREITDWAKIPPADYGDELAKCQRYCMMYNLYAQWRSADVQSNYIDFTIQLPISMRTHPAIVNSVNFLVVNQSGFTFSVAAMSGNNIRMRAAKTEHGLSTAILILGGIAGFSADL